MAFGRKKAKQEQEDATARALLASELATLRTIMERYPAGSMLSFGSPSRCPECGDYGIVRGVNHAKGACDNHCRVCRRDWTITARALQAFYLASTGPSSALVQAMSEHDEPLSLDDEPLSIEPADPEEVIPPPAPVMADYPAAVLANHAEPGQAAEPVHMAEPGQAAEPAHMAEPGHDPEPVPADPAAPVVEPVPRLEPAPATPTPEPVAAAAPAPPIPPPPVEVAAQTPLPTPPLPPPPVEAATPTAPPTQTLPPPPAPADTPVAPVAPVAVEPVAVDLTEPLPLLRVLVVDDNLFDFAMIEELLEPFVANGEIELEHRATRRQGEEAVRSFPFDLVLLDLDLHDTTGLTTVLEWNHRAGEPLPLIALIDEADADLTQQTSTAGIHAVIQKAHIEKLTTQGEAGQKRLQKLLRSTAAKAIEVPPDPRWRRKRTKSPLADPTRVDQVQP